MADITYDFTAQSDENPWVEEGWSKPTGSIDGRISLGLFTSTSSTNAIYLYNTAPVPVANKISVGIINGNFTGDPSGSRGQAIMSLAGDGYFTLVRSTDLRVYKTTIGGGANTLTQIGSTTTITAADLDNFLFEYDVVTGAINITQGGVSPFTATDTTHIFTGGVLDPAKVAALRLGVCSRAATGRVRSVTAYGVPAGATLAIPNDITLLTEYTDNAATGFADGAATLSYGGVNVAVTVASELFDFTLPMIAHDVVSPRLPAVGAEFTLTQDELTATTTANIELPEWFDTTRVGDVSGGDPANFAGIVDDDPTYIGYAFAQASNDLTTSDSAVFVTSDGYLVGRNTFVQWNEFEIDGITPVLPRTDDLYVWRASTGKYYEHSITLTDAGAVIVDGVGLSVVGLSASGLSVRGPSVSGL